MFAHSFGFQAFDWSFGGTTVEFVCPAMRRMQVVVPRSQLSY